MKNLLSTLAVLVAAALLVIYFQTLLTFAGFKSEFAAPLNQEVAVPGMIAPAKQLEIWNAEHQVFQVEHRFGRRLADLLKSEAEASLEAPVQAMLHPGFTARLFDNAQWQPVEGLPISFESQGAREPSESATTAAELRSGLLQPFARLAAPIAEGAAVSEFKVGRVRFDVLKFEPTDDEVGSCQVRLTVDAVTPAGLAATLVSEHELNVKLAGFNVAPTILDWSTTAQRLASSARPLLVEDESLREFDELFPDNWKRQTANDHSLQMAVEDFDRDGDWDIATMNYTGERRLFRNDDGRFVYVNEELGLPVIEKDPVNLNVFATTWLDYNNDGFPDLVSGNKLFRNQYGKLFVDETSDSRLFFLTEPLGYSPIDFDGDGDMDVYAIFQRPTGLSAMQFAGDEIDKWISGCGTGLENTLYRNNGDGTFSDVSLISGAAGTKVHSQAASWFRDGDDRFPDLFVANEFGPNVAFASRGKALQVVDDFPGTRADFTSSHGVAIADVDRDGINDVFLSNVDSIAGRRLLDWLQPQDFESGLYEKLKAASIGSQLFLSSNSDPAAVVEDSGLQETGWAWGPAWFDLDSNGWLDLYVPNGGWSYNVDQPDAQSAYFRRAAFQPTDPAVELPQIGPLDVEHGEAWGGSLQAYRDQRLNLAAYQRNRLYLNDGQARFVDASGVSGAGIEFDSRSVVAADFDQDGDLDLLVGSAGGGGLRLFKNQTPQGNRIEIRLKGGESNRLGIGARIEAVVAGQKIVRDLFTSSGFLANGPAAVWIGMGTADKIEELTIKWPSGSVDKLKDIDANQSIRVEEGNPKVETIKRWE